MSLFLVQEQFWCRNYIVHLTMQVRCWMNEASIYESVDIAPVCLTHVVHMRFLKILSFFVAWKWLTTIIGIGFLHEIRIISNICISPYSSYELFLQAAVNSMWDISFVITLNDLRFSHDAYISALWCLDHFNFILPHFLFLAEIVP